MDTYSNTFLWFQLRMDPFGDDEVAKQYMLDAIAEEDARTADSFLNMSGDADEEDDDFVPPPNHHQHVPVRILIIYAW